MSCCIIAINQNSHLEYPSTNYNRTSIRPTYTAQHLKLKHFSLSCILNNISSDLYITQHITLISDITPFVCYHLCLILSLYVCFNLPHNQIVVCMYVLIFRAIRLWFVVCMYVRPVSPQISSHGSLV